MKRFLSVLISASILLCITGCHTNRGTGDVQAASSSPAESEESLPETSDELSESPNDSDESPEPSVDSDESSEPSVDSDESPEPSVDSDESSEPSDDSSIPAERQMEHSYERSYVLMGSEGNQTEHDVCAGDEITIEVENTSGTIDISIQIDGETLYDKKGIKEESCTLEVDTDGHCMILVVGHRASGHFAINHYAGSENS